MFKGTGQHFNTSLQITVCCVLEVNMTNRRKERQRDREIEAQDTRERRCRCGCIMKMCDIKCLIKMSVCEFNTSATI